MSKTNALKRKELFRIFEYLVTGGAWFWSGYAMFAVCYSLLGLDIITSKIIASLFGLTINYILERNWVFTGRDAQKNTATVTTRYVILSSVNIVIDAFIVWGLAQVGITPYIGQFASAGFFTVWNYLWYRLWVFAKPVALRKQASPVLRHPKNIRHARRKALYNA